MPPNLRAQITTVGAGEQFAADAWLQCRGLATGSAGPGRSNSPNERTYRGANSKGEPPDRPQSPANILLRKAHAGAERQRLRGAGQSTVSAMCRSTAPSVRRRGRAERGCLPARPACRKKSNAWMPGSDFEGERPRTTRQAVFSCLPAFWPRRPLSPPSPGAARPLPAACARPRSRSAARPRRRPPSGLLPGGSRRTRWRAIRFRSAGRTAADR